MYVFVYVHRIKGQGHFLVHATSFAAANGLMVTDHGLNPIDYWLAEIREPSDAPLHGTVVWGHWSGDPIPPHLLGDAEPKPKAGLYDFVYEFKEGGGGYYIDADSIPEAEEKLRLRWGEAFDKTHLIEIFEVFENGIGKRIWDIYCSFPIPPHIAGVAPATEPMTQSRLDEIKRGLDDVLPHPSNHIARSWRLTAHELLDEVKRLRRVEEDRLRAERNRLPYQPDAD